MFTPDNIKIAEVVKILREQNPTKTDSDIEKLIYMCMDTNIAGTWEMHSFLCSGYADGWVYDLGGDDE